MIYLVGDTHGFIDFEKVKIFANSRKFSKKDFLIILGDCGITTTKKYIKEKIKLYSSLPFTVLFIDGNHEGFEYLNNMKVSYFHGGKVHKFSNSLYHLLRGQVFNFDGINLLTLGGADSTDKAYRVKGESWWEEERITLNDLDEANKNLLKVNYKVDYVLSHCLPYSVASAFKWGNFEVTPSEQMLESMIDEVEFTRWFGGHYHQDMCIGKFVEMYNNIYLINKYTIEKI